MSQKSSTLENPKPTVHVTSGGRVYVDATEQLSTENAQKAIEGMEKLFEKLDSAKPAGQESSEK